MLLGLMVALPFVATARAQQGPARVAGTWHVVVPGWGIEDHLLIVQEHDGVMTGKFEFANIEGAVTGTRFQFDVTDAGGRLILQFEGTISGDHMEGTVSSPKDGPLVEHGIAVDLTTKWTATRDANAG
jgi:hypothetical protein